MDFKDFAQKLASVIRAGCSTDKFTRALFEAVLSDDGQCILDEYTSSSYKGFYNGNTSIKRISNKINAYIEPMSFSAYIHNFSDAAVESLCSVFADEIPNIDSYNAGDRLSELFVAIIIEAAGAKKSTSKGALGSKSIPPVILDSNNGIVPELPEQKGDGQIFISTIGESYFRDIKISTAVEVQDGAVEKVYESDKVGGCFYNKSEYAIDEKNGSMGKDKKPPKIKISYRSDMLNSEMEQIFLSWSPTVIDLNCYPNAYLSNDNRNAKFVIRTTCHLNFEMAPDCTLQIRVYFTINDTEFSGFASSDNWDSQSYLNNRVSVGNYTCIAWFKVINPHATKPQVHFFMIGETDG